MCACVVAVSDGAQSREDLLALEASLVVDIVPADEGMAASFGAAQAHKVSLTHTPSFSVLVSISVTVIIALPSTSPTLRTRCITTRLQCTSLRSLCAYMR